MEGCLRQAKPVWWERWKEKLAIHAKKKKNWTVEIDVTLFINPAGFLRKKGRLRWRRSRANFHFEGNEIYQAIKILAQSQRKREEKVKETILGILNEKILLATKSHCLSAILAF